MSDEFWPSTHMSLLLSVRDPRNSAAWGEFVGRYRPKILAHCRRLGVQEAAAEDVAQGLLLKLIKAMQGFEYDPQKSFRAWLATVTKNAVRDFWREEGQRLDAGTGESAVQQLLRNAPEDKAKEEFTDALGEELRRDLLAEAEKLVAERVDGATWEAYRRRRDGERAKEIGANLDMKTAAVHKANSRVKQMLREEVAMLLKQPRS
jgi:RNA polymerase sigma-70 factor (ECF subfamily)